MREAGENDWNPGAYDRFRGLRLRPALDLLGAVGPLPAGPVTDLGCGSGAAGPVLRARYGDRWIGGVDASPAMLAVAQETGAYDALAQGDATEWRPEAAQALIFSNALLHWLDGHAALLVRLAGALAPGGVLAVQVPGMNDAPSHAAWRELTGDLVAGPGILSVAEYHAILMPLGAVDIWETLYYQRLDPSQEGHPVRLFTQSTYGKPFLEAQAPEARAALCAACDARMERAYPRQADGAVVFPFRRVFFTLRAGT